MREDTDWLEDDPAYASERFASEDYCYFIRAIQCDVLDEVAKMAEGYVSKADFLLSLSKLYRRLKPTTLEELQNDDTKT